MAEVLERWCQPGVENSCEVHKCPAGWGPKQKMCLELLDTPVQCRHCDHKAAHGNFVGGVTQKETWKVGGYLCPRTKTPPALETPPMEERDEYHFVKWALDTGRVGYIDYTNAEGLREVVDYIKERMKPAPDRNTVSMALYEGACKSLSEMTQVRDEAVREREALRLEAHKAQRSCASLQTYLDKARADCNANARKCHELEAKWREVEERLAATVKNRDYWYEAAKRLQDELTRLKAQQSQGSVVLPAMYRAEHNVAYERSEDMPTTISLQKPVKFPRIKRALRWGRKLGYAAALLWMGGYINEHGALGLVLDVGNAYRGWITAMANDEEAGEYEAKTVCAECAGERSDTAGVPICPKCGSSSTRAVVGRTIERGTWPFTPKSYRFEEKPASLVPILPPVATASGG